MCCVTKKYQESLISSVFLTIIWNEHHNLYALLMKKIWELWSLKWGKLYFCHQVIQHIGHDR